jgi:hypothetical protein
MTVAAVLDDEVSPEETQAIIDGLSSTEAELVKSASMLALQLGVPLERAVPLVYQHCMKEATL